MAYIVLLLAQPGCTDRRQVVEHHRHVLVDQGPQQAGDHGVHIGVMVHQRIHAAQQLLVRQRRSVDLRHVDGLQPAQHAKLGVCVTQAVEHHRSQRMLHRGGEPSLAEYAGQGIEAEFAPYLIERADIAKR